MRGRAIILFVFSATILASLQAAAAQRIGRAYAGHDGKAHIVYANGDAKTISPEPKQVRCDEVAVAADGRTVGWLMLVENCCTSYPVATAVVLYRDQKKTVISTGQMIWQWHFVASGDRVAVLSGPVHGAAAAALLYDSRSGKRLASWHGDGAVPSWAESWQPEFPH